MKHMTFKTDFAEVHIFFPSRKSIEGYKNIM